MNTTMPYENYVISQLSMAFPIFLHRQTQNINYCAYQNIIKIIFRTCFDITCARLGAYDGVVSIHYVHIRKSSCRLIYPQAG